MGTTEIIFIFIIYLLLFGAKGIPSLAQTMGKAVRQFRDASSDIQREIMNTGNEIKAEVNKVKDQVTKDEVNQAKDQVAKDENESKDQLPQ